MRVLISFLLLISLLTGCAGSSCIPADEFTNNYTTVDSYHKKGAPNYQGEFDIEDGSSKIDGSINREQQIIKWKNTGIKTDGNKLTVKIRGAWTSWFGKDGITTVDKKDICDFQEGSNCKVVADNSENKQGAPCWFTKGVGAYVLLRRPNDPDPNEYKYLLKPVSPTIHLAYDQGDNFVASDMEANEESIIYVKILDTYYEDNSGHYTLQFLTGVKLTNVSILEKIYDMVYSIVEPSKDTPNAPSVVETGFKNLTGLPSFQSLVQLIILFSVAYYGFTYLLGLGQRSIGEIIINLLKISLLVQLISPTGWRFYHDYFFSIFINGLDTTLKLLLSSADTSLNIDPNKNVFAFLDDLIFGELLTTTTFTKVCGVLGTFPGLGPVWFLIILICLWVYVGGLAYIVMLILAAWLVIALLLLIFPIMLAFLLVELKLKDMFKNWVNYMLSQCFQVIIAVAALALFTNLVMFNVHRILGVSMCIQPWIKVNWCPIGGICDSLNFTIKAWTYGTYTPTQVYINSIQGGYYKFEGPMAMRKTPIGCERNLKSTSCDGIESCRHEDYPYLDWGKGVSCNSANINQAPDSAAIENLVNGEIMKWLMLDVLSLLLISVIFYYIKDSLSAIGRQIAGVSPFSHAALGTMADSIWGGIKNIGLKQYNIGNLLQFPALFVQGGIDKLGQGLKKTARSGINLGARSLGQGVKSASDALGNRLPSALQQPYKFVTKAAAFSAKTAVKFPIFLGKELSSTGTEQKFLKYQAEGKLTSTDYIPHLIGSHIETVLEPFSGTKFLLKHAATKLSHPKRSVVEDFKQSYNTEMGAIHDGILGVKKPGPTVRQPEEESKIREGSGSIFSGVSMEDGDHSMNNIDLSRDSTSHVREDSAARESTAERTDLTDNARTNSTTSRNDINSNE